MDTQKTNPELAKVLKQDIELQQQRSKLVKQLQSAPKKQKDKIQKELKEVISLRFDIIIMKKQLQYEDLRKKLEKLQKEVQHRESELDKLKQKKPDAIGKRYEELVGKTEKIGWD